MYQSRGNRIQLAVAGLHVCLILATTLLWPTAMTVASSPSAAEAKRFSAPTSLIGGQADWVTFDGYQGVLGSGTSLTIADVQGEVTLKSRLQLDTPVSEGLLVMNSLYLVERVEETERLVVVDLNEPDRGAFPVELDPTPKGFLHLARIDDYLLVAEDGYGVRILALPHPHHAGSGMHDRPELVQVGVFLLEEEVTAITASLRTIYIATSNGLTVVDVLIPALPSLVLHTPLEDRFHAMAANGSLLYLLGVEGLQLIDFAGGDGPVFAGSYPEVDGRSIYLAGRTTYLAGDEGLVSVEDVSPAQVTINIQVGDIFYNPSGAVAANVGDTVTWTKPSTVFPHNVFSCDGVFLQCGGTTATEVFVSGAVTTAPFPGPGATFSHTFNLVGNNLYLCQAHPVTMVGDIVVSGGPASPPRVADGTLGTTPMTVQKLVPSGADLRLFYDAAACAPDADDHNILFSTGSLLPASLLDAYPLTGSTCNIGTTSPFDWIGSPAPPVTGDLFWWLIVADDGGGTEGSWSENSAIDRRGVGINDSSNQCGNFDKDLTNTCPP